jgi:hypothetical protein
VVEFSDDVGIEFFNDQSYLLDRGTVGSSNPGDVLWTCGALKENSSFHEDPIHAEFARLEFIDVGPLLSDITMRKATAKYQGLQFETLTGISGSPVFNSTQKKLCGMVTRGGLTEGIATIHYLDMEDIFRALEAIENGALATSYEKTVLQLRKTP